MMVLGIDPGTATTGYGLVRENDQGGLQAVEYGVILTPVGLEPQKRLLLLYDRLNEILLLHRPTLGAVEKLFFRRNVTTAISVGQARGVALLAMARAKGCRVGQGYLFSRPLGAEAIYPLLKMNRLEPGEAAGRA